MNLTLLFTALVASTVLAVDDSSNATTTPSTELAVEIDVDCPGVDFAKLTLKAAGYSAEALQETYNKVHEDVDGGDAFLEATHFDRPIKKKSSMLRRSGKYFTHLGGFGTLWYCRLCRPDDDALFDLTGGSMALRAWESAFATALLESGHPNFADVKTCTIQMINKSADEEEEEDDEAAGLQVEIDVDCPEVDFAKLSLKAAGFSSGALQSTYNEVHKETDGGDAYISTTHFEHAIKKKKSSMLGRSGKYFTHLGGFGTLWYCRLCRPDDDALFDLVGGSTVLRAWEAAFVTALLESGHTEFEKVKTCTITMFPKPAVMADGPVEVMYLATTN